MQIQVIVPQMSFAGIKKQNKFNSVDNLKKLSYTKDSFEKQNSEISFTAKKKGNNKDNLGSSLSNVKMKGLPFLLGVVTSAAMVKMGEQASELLCDTDGYLVTEDGVFSDLVNIDIDEQILEFKGTGISINADDYDYVDWENGIFKNHDGSVDINFGEGRFIDTINGIIVDPEHEVSGILDNGVMQTMAIPNFNTSFGSGYPTGVVDDRWGTLQREHARRNPELYEQKNPFEKAAEFIKGLFKEDSMPQVDNVQDIFGNEIITAKDNNGDTYLASYLQKEIEENPIFAEFKTKFGKEVATERANGERLEQYIREHYPNFGTRILVYEGGRHATGGSGWSRFDYNVADTNKDRKLSPDELKEYIQGLSRDKNGKLDKEGTAKFFELFDTNRDGKITLDEIMDVLDLDDNGTISFDELLGFFDLDGNGETTLGEFFEGIMRLIFRRD